MFTVIALLFVGNVARVAFLAPDATLRTFEVANTATGLAELTAKLQPVLRTATGKPLVCMGAAEGSSLQGVVFEELVLDDSVRRFLYAQPKYILEAKAKSMPTDDPTTLFRVCTDTFPSGHRS